LPKDCGGLNLKRLRSFSIALLGKQAAKLVIGLDHKCNPWVDIVVVKYSSHGEFSHKKCESWSWKAIVNTCHLLKQILWHHIGDGRTPAFGWIHGWGNDHLWSMVWIYRV